MSGFEADFAEFLLEFFEELLDLEELLALLALLELLELLALLELLESKQLDEFLDINHVLLFKIS